MAKEKESLDAVLARINKSVGDGSVYKYSDYTGIPTERLRSGSIGIDILTGGGWVIGQMNYLSGWESSGKSTLCLYAIAETQKLGGVAAYIDHEYSFDKTYATSLGVDVDSMILAQPDCIEDGYQIALDLIESGQINTLIFDSIAAAIPKKELEGDVGDKTMAEKARLNSINFPKFCSHAKKNNVTLIFVNQLREKIGVMFASPVTEPGGNSVKFYPSIKIEVQQSTKLKDGDDVAGNLVKANCKKNKTARPFKTCEYNIVYGLGIDRNAEVLHYAEQLGIILKAGSWYSLADGGTKIGQGGNKALEFLSENPDLVELIEERIYENILKL